MNKCPERLYMYLRLDTFGLKKLIALLNGTVPLTKVSWFNDPFDSQLSFDHTGTQYEQTEDIQRSIDRGQIGEERVQSMESRIFEDGFISTRAVFCVTECWDSCLMWSHYADSHKGICVELAYDKDTRLPDGCEFGKVRYSTHYPRPVANRIEDPSEFQTLFLTKSTDWMYEHEWRLIATVDNHLDKTKTFDGLISRSPFTVARILCGVKCQNSMDVRDLYQGAGLPGSKEILSDEDCGFVEKLEQRYLDGDVNGAYTSLLRYLEKFKVDRKKDTLERASAKEEIISTAILQILNFDGYIVRLKKSDVRFAITQL
ncbi:hypothetical protein PDESU_06424 [Pontiella desulfatans]|uniref:DUF2971 domain-containing protein n=1 Tax=Pontiella desulfatans TaxID=2750659 RepID=A0A6C2UCA6_PONDE|nr:DUF2971 domain-containing protein [Pontiella desulfatans]VGO17822.1 hypothetical protein PDESU_06424 [Pontiella desulfatans]